MTVNLGPDGGGDLVRLAPRHRLSGMPGDDADGGVFQEGGEKLLDVFGFLIGYGLGGFETGFFGWLMGCSIGLIAGTLLGKT